MDVKKPKRRYRVYNSTFHVDDVTLTRHARQAMIREAKKRKHSKSRIIQRERDTKQDDGRGEEAEIDMWPETLNSMLSSRIARPFDVIHTYTETAYVYCFGRLYPYMSTVQNVVARGTLYTGHKMKSITVLHEFEDEPVRRITDQEFDIGLEIKSLFPPDVEGTFRTYYL